LKVEEMTPERAVAVPRKVIEIRDRADVVPFPEPPDDPVPQFLGSPPLIGALGCRQLGRSDAFRRQRDDRGSRFRGHAQQPGGLKMLR
jgi:hypothetical protein